jgi:hypothetical protein
MYFFRSYIRKYMHTCILYNSITSSLSINKRYQRDPKSATGVFRSLLGRADQYSTLFPDKVKSKLYPRFSAKINPMTESALSSNLTVTLNSEPNPKVMTDIESGSNPNLRTDLESITKAKSSSYP